MCIRDRFIGDSVTQGFAWYPEYRDWMRVCAYKGVNPQSILQNLSLIHI